MLSHSAPAANNEQDKAFANALQQLFLPLLPAADKAAHETLAELLSALLAQLAQGHVCLPLHRPLPAALQALIGEATANAPAPPPFALVVDGQKRLYFRRQYTEEYTLATHLNALLAQPGAASGAAPQSSALAQKLHPQQQQAVTQSLHSRLLCISGGPGTGKTTTVAAILEALQAQQRHRIALAAPTGKAAARLLQALQDATADSPALAACAANNAANTVHRLLGMRPDGSCRHHAANPVAADIVIVDEASMLDLALASRLLAAIRADARLILLGDPDQLAAVEAGSVFALLSEHLPANNRVRLSHSHRFGDQQPIGQLAQALRDGEAEQAWRVACADTAGLDWHEAASAAALPAPLQAMLIAAFAPYQQAVQQYTPAQPTPAAVFAARAQFQLLAAHYEGTCGIHALNEMLAEALFQPASRQTWYHGRTILISANDPQNALFNGDSGICLTAEDGSLRVFFAAANNTWRSLSPAMLPAHEDALAISVHKAQGSEYEHVACILPAPQSPLLCREWLYTALTRARNRLSLIGEKSAFFHACTTPTKRISGLAERLRETAGRQP